MRISDWSSDVCSSDLRGIDERIEHQRTHDDEADRPRLHADDLIVEQQQERAEARILDAVGGRPEGVSEGGRIADPARRGGRGARAHLANASSAANSEGVSGSQLWRGPIVSPPSTSSEVPVMNDASSLARKAIAAAMSSAVPVRWIGCALAAPAAIIALARCCASPAIPSEAVKMLVAMKPGTTALTRI